ASSAGIEGPADQLYRCLFESAADAILVADAASRYLDANAAATVLLGYSREELLRLRVPDVVARQTAWTEAEYGRFREAGLWRGQLELRRRDGSTVAVEARATTIRLPTGTVYASIIRDVSERRRIEAQLREETESLETLNRIGRLLSGELEPDRL